MELTVVIPLLNEAEILASNLERFAAHCDRIVGAGKWKYVIVDNGSTDETPAILERVLPAWPGSRRIVVPEPDYGKALRAGLDAVDTPWAKTIDIEQWDIPFLAWAWRNRDDHDLFIGAKRADPTINRQSTQRMFLSWGLNALINLFFQYSGSDTHGPKLLRMSALRPILSQCTLSRGQFDAEFVIRGFRQGLRILEAPIAYQELRPPRAKMFFKIWTNVREFTRLFLLLRRIGYSGPVRLRRVCREDLTSGQAAERSDQGETRVLS